MAALDYVQLKLHHFNKPMKTKMQRNPHFKVRPKQMVFRSTTSRESAQATVQPQVSVIAKADEQLAMHLHNKCGHQNMDYVWKRATLRKMKGLPKSIPDLKYPCPICKIAAAPKIPRGKLTDPTELRKGDCIYADWIIMNTEWVRGFKRALILREVRTCK